MSASPSAAAWMAWVEQLGARVLEQEPACAGLERAVHVLVEVERGDDHDGHRVLDAGPGELAGGLDAVQHRHADVEQADVGPQLAGEVDRLAPVGRGADHLDVGLGVEDHRPARCARSPGRRRRPPGSSCAHASTSGSTAVTVQPRSGFGPAWKRAAEQRGPFGHADDAVARRGTGGGEVLSPSSLTVRRTQSRLAGRPRR